MSNIDFSQIQLQNIITHNVGNKLRDEKYILSDKETVIREDTKDYLLKYLILTVKKDLVYNFFHATDINLNEVSNSVNQFFSNEKSFVELSQVLAKLLYEKSMHPKIQQGKLNVVFISNIEIDNQLTDAIGIFKSETNVPFLKMESQNKAFEIFHDFGYDLKGIDKGCLILNTIKNGNYKILFTDNSLKSSEAQYWKDEFLKVIEEKNEFHQTNQFLGITKQFITKQFPHDFEISKADQIDLLNRSVDYFKKHDNFDKQEFENEVLQHDNIINSFQKFDTAYRQENEIEIADDFSISAQAVKKQERVFKSVLKLDKNFHIYIHGDRQLIEQGVEKDGRKFYKIYYKDES